MTTREVNEHLAAIGKRKYGNQESVKVTEDQEGAIERAVSKRINNG